MTTTKDKKLTANLSAMPQVKAKGKRDGETVFSALYVNDWQDAETKWTLDSDTPVYDTEESYDHSFINWMKAIDSQVDTNAYNLTSWVEVGKLEIEALDRADFFETDGEGGWQVQSWIDDVKSMLTSCQELDLEGLLSGFEDGAWNYGNRHAGEGVEEDLPPNLSSWVGDVDENLYAVGALAEDADRLATQAFDLLTHTNYGSSISLPLYLSNLNLSIDIGDNNGEKSVLETLGVIDEWIGAFDPEYQPYVIDLASTFREILQTIDTELSTLNAGNQENWVHIGYLEDGNGSYYVEGQDGYEWQFPSAATYLSAAGNLTEALSSLNLGLENATTAGAVTLSARATAETGYAATYDLHQGGVLKGSINIPKDFLVKSAALSTVTTADVPYAGAVVGDKYIDFVINAKDASATAEHIYLPVNDLVDVYTAQQNATQVQLAIDNNNVISAAIVAGSIGTTELSANAVTTAKIADDAVTTAKILSGAVTNAKIADNAINAAKLSADSVTTDKILSGAVTTAKVADNAITTAKIANGAVTTDKLAYLSSIILIDQTSDTTSEHYSALWQLKVVEGRLMVEQFVPSA